MLFKTLLFCYYSLKKRKKKKKKTWTCTPNHELGTDREKISKRVVRKQAQDLLALGLSRQTINIDLGLGTTVSSLSQVGSKVTGAGEGL